MSLFDIVRISLNAIKINKIRAALTMLGIIIGVASVIILVSLVGGITKSITQELSGLGTDLIVIFPGEPGGARGPGGAVANKMEFRHADLIKERVADVSDVMPTIFGSGTLKYKNKTLNGAEILAAPGSFFEIRSMDLESGRTFGLNDTRNVAVIGTTVRDEFFKDVNPLGKEITVKNKKLEVIGVLEKRGAVAGQDQNNMVIMPLAAGKAMLGVDRPNAFYAKVAPGADTEVTKNRIEKTLLKYLEDEDFTVSTPEEFLNILKNILGILSLGLGGVAAISLIVGGIGIMNIMIVSVTERTREIGLRKALGARRQDILMQFLIEAIILSILGGIIGVALGILASIGINSFITTDTNPIYVLIAFSFSAVVGIVFGIAPAIRASRLAPIEALRYE